MSSSPRIGISWAEEDSSQGTSSNKVNAFLTLHAQIYNGTLKNCLFFLISQLLKINLYQMEKFYEKQIRE